MNLQEIAIFKRFMGQHDLRKNFIKKYKNSIGLTHNPESVEKYFSNVEPEKVITSAVKHFITNEAMGYDFWQSVDMSWQAYLHKMRESHTIEREEAGTLRGYYAALRENWDNDKPWIYEPISVAQIRYGIAVEPSSEIDDVNFEEDKQEQTVEESPLVDFTEDDPLADFDFIDSPTPMNVRLKSNEASLNFNNGSYKITFNRVVTEQVNKSGMPFIRLAKNKSGDICFIINRREGTKLSRSSHSKAANENITLNSKEITTKIRTLFNVKTDYSILNIEQLTTSSDYIIYKVTKQ